ncbi:MAG TPA: hypothetical protein VG520_05150 [Candidatus Dormibacteraeota bacterium]|nr:hypothetical protein [Candidatus Dormibacteraeota bacterium]
MRRRLAVSAAVLAALAGEWLGHSLAYYRVAGSAGLQAGLSSGVHDYMLPLGVALLLGAAAGATVWTRAWLALGRRLDGSRAALARLRRGGRLGPVPEAAAVPSAPLRTPSPAARVAALAVPLAFVQCAVYLVQENLERAVHGMAAPGAAPLLDGFGAAAWIQGAVALLLATVLVAGARLLRSRGTAAAWCEHLVRALWERTLRGTSSPAPAAIHVTAAGLLLGSALWQRPPPRPAAA